MSQLPASIIVVDVETTGLHSGDRIVTLGAWRINTADLALDSINAECLHIIIDPGRKSHPRAEEIHGYSDWTLRHQESFSEQADTVRDFLLSGDLVIAHNASFDLEFIDREYRILGKRGPELHSYCTMNGYRQSGRHGRASLNAICQEIGLSRVGMKHGALEDAWLAMMVFFWLHQVDPKHIQPFALLASKGAPLTPSNFRQPPPLPVGPLPRRRRSADDARQDKAVSGTTAAAKTALMKGVRPMAILLIEIARADGLVTTEEIEILSDLVRTIRDRLGLSIDDEAERGLLAELMEITPTQNLLTRAARSVYQDPAARETFPKLLANIARADGSFSDAGRAAVDRIKAAIARALQKTPNASG